MPRIFASCCGAYLQTTRCVGYRRQRDANCVIYILSMRSSCDWYSVVRCVDRFPTYFHRRVNRRYRRRVKASGRNKEAGQSDTEGVLHVCSVPTPHWGRYALPPQVVCMFCTILISKHTYTAVFVLQPPVLLHAPT